MPKSMPIVKHFNIELDKSQRLYRAGESVRGKCLLDVEGVLKLRHLDINLVCEGSVDCKQTKLEKESMSVLIGKCDLIKRSSTDQTLQGFVAIDFSFSIPEKGQPSSFAGKFGFIRYKIEAVLQKDWDVFRKEVVIAVIAPYNSCPDNLFLAPIGTRQKKIGIFNDYIDVYAKVDKAWFTPGDKVSVYCNVENISEHKLRLSLSLYQKQDYMFHKIKSKVSADETFDLIEPMGKSYSKRLLFGIPSNLKTMSLECKIIKIGYLIRVLVEILETKETLKVDLPIILTIAAKCETTAETVSLPPSYSDCQIFQRFASEDLCLPFYKDNDDDEFETDKSDTSDDKGFVYDKKEPKSPPFVDLPPSYDEAMLGYEYKAVY